jgi:enoyl-CoA hydratase
LLTKDSEEDVIDRFERRSILKKTKQNLMIQKRFMSLLTTVERVDDGKIAVLRLNKPAQLNSVCSDMAQSFKDSILSIVDSQSQLPRALIVTGSGRAFSAGGDMNFIRERMATESGELNRRVMLDYYDKLLTLRRVPCPVIAAINGDAVGAGCCLAAWCDFRLIESGARVGVNFTRLGLSPGMGATYILPRIVGAQSAARMLYAGRMIDADEAVRVGFAMERVESAYDAALLLARDIGEAAPTAVRSAVHSMRAAVVDDTASLAAALTREADSQAMIYPSDELKEGMNAIAERRKPVY